jgi:hypothetical protein
VAGRPGARQSFTASTREPARLATDSKRRRLFCWRRPFATSSIRAHQRVEMAQRAGPTNGFIAFNRFYWIIMMMMMMMMVMMMAPSGFRLNAATSRPITGERAGRSTVVLQRLCGRAKAAARQPYHGSRLATRPGRFRWSLRRHKTGMRPAVAASRRSARRPSGRKWRT